MSPVDPLVELPLGEELAELHIRNLPKKWAASFSAVATIKHMTNAQFLMWLMITHPEIKATTAVLQKHTTEEATPDGSQQGARASRTRISRRVGR